MRLPNKNSAGKGFHKTRAASQQCMRNALILALRATEGNGRGFTCPWSMGHHE